MPRRVKRLLIILITLSIIMPLFSVSSVSWAQTKTDVKYKIGIGIPQSGYNLCTGSNAGFAPGERTIGKNTIAELICAIYAFGVPIGGVLAIILLLWSGLMRVSSAASSEMVSQSEEIMWAALGGLAVLLFSWIILNTINPNLLKLKSLGLTDVHEYKAEPVNIDTDKWQPPQRVDAYSAVGNRQNVYAPGTGACLLWHRNDPGGRRICIIGKTEQECRETADQSDPRNPYTHLYYPNSNSCPESKIGQIVPGGACISGDGLGRTCYLLPQDRCTSSGDEFFANATCTDFGACFTPSTLNTWWRGHYGDCTFEKFDNCQGGKRFCRSKNCLEVGDGGC